MTKTSTDVRDYDDIELIQRALEWAGNNEKFNPDFLRKMETVHNEYGSLTERQSHAVRNMVRKWRMLHPQRDKAPKKRQLVDEQMVVSGCATVGVPLDATQELVKELFGGA